jgi:hypothetical protein
MHLRRALLLFAIVLGVAALAASLAPPPREISNPARTDTAPPPTTLPEAEALPPRGETVRVEFDVSAERPAVHRVKTGDHVIVSVLALDAGEARLDDLGLVADVSPETPATFDLLPSRPGRHRIVYRSAMGTERRAGTLIVLD